MRCGVARLRSGSARLSIGVARPRRGWRVAVVRCGAAAARARPSAARRSSAARRASAWARHGPAGTARQGQARRGRMTRDGVTWHAMVCSAARCGAKIQIRVWLCSGPVMVITTAICHSRSIELSLWLSNLVDDDTRLKYLHGFLEMVSATHVNPLFILPTLYLPTEHFVHRRTNSCY